MNSVPPSNNLPAVGRIDSEKTARLLGFAASDIAILIRARLLKPLGNPVPNAPKYFAAAEVLQLAVSREWLDKATRATSLHWRERNERVRRRAKMSSPPSFITTNPQ